MPKRSSKGKTRLPDPAVMASRIVKAISGEPAAEPPSPDDGKNPAAVALGRLGGLKGGKARADKLSAKRRKQIAQKAAQSRWNKKL